MDLHYHVHGLFFFNCSSLAKDLSVCIWEGAVCGWGKSVLIERGAMLHVYPPRFKIGKSSPNLGNGMKYIIFFPHSYLTLRRRIREDLWKAMLFMRV